MTNEEPCCCSSVKASPEEAKRACMSKLSVAFKWIARGAVLYFALFIVAQWVLFFTSPNFATATTNDYIGGLLSSVAYAVLGGLAWAVFTAFSLILSHLLILPTSACNCGEGK